MFAIIENGSRQHRVQEGDLLSVDFQSEAEAGSSLTFDRVLLANGGGASVIGAPTIEGATVTGEVVLDEEKGPKVGGPKDPSTQEQSSSHWPSNRSLLELRSLRSVCQILKSLKKRSQKKHLQPSRHRK